MLIDADWFVGQVAAGGDYREIEFGQQKMM
jgi:hypothetical protein